MNTKRTKKYWDPICNELLSNTLADVWKRGEEYYKRGIVSIDEYEEFKCKGQIKHERNYKVSITIGPKHVTGKCTCPYRGDGYCKHIAALGMLWDEKRGFKKPSKIQVKEIAPEKQERISMAMMNKNPLAVNLKLLRNSAGVPGGWTRPHAELPNAPYELIDNAKLELDIEEINAAFQDLTSWTRKGKYDLYFCAGEMIAGFCETIKIVKKRLAVSPPPICAEVLLRAGKFYIKLLTKLIDSSDGTWEIAKAYLEDFEQAVKALKPDENDKEEFNKFINKFDEIMKTL
jgi:hypothetical protein